MKIRRVVCMHLSSGVVRNFLFCFAIAGSVAAGGQARAQQLFTQNTYPLVDFRSPLDIVPPALSGSFGELRANHFHSGMDFRTNQRQGYPIYAVGDGYVSRLRVQNSGFGLVVYINHPNGYTSVYGHMQRFSPKIAREVKALQYGKKSYEIDEFPSSILLPVRKGDVIGYSGNSGSSGGPHLHFEIRDTRTEATINPQLFGIEIPDNIPPVIRSMYVYRLDGKPFNEFTPKQYFPLSGSSGKYRLNGPNTIPLSGEIGFGIVTGDRHNGASGNNGVYSIELELDGQKIYTSALEKFQFQNSRAINSHIDYPAYLKTKVSIQKSFVDPGNPLQIYPVAVNRGRISFSDGKLHELKYTVSDARGNKSTLIFNVQAGNSAASPAPPTTQGQLFGYGQANEFSNGLVKVVLPKGTLYNDLNFQYKSMPRPSANAYSAVHQVHNTFTPLHTGFELWIKADRSLIPFAHKALVVNTNRVSQGGQYENGFVKASPRTFGNFFISIDTLPPVIVPVNIAQGKSMAGISKMSFRISDNLSGIKSFNGYIDGKWVLMEFDAKTASLWHTFDSLTQPGKHTFELVVADMKDNVRTYKIDFNK